MLENWAVPQKPEREEIKLRLRTAKERLSKQQMCLKEHGLPVLVLMESALFQGGYDGKYRRSGGQVSIFTPLFCADTGSRKIYFSGFGMDE